MDVQLSSLSNAVPSPTPHHEGGKVMQRYSEKTVEQAMVQKLARTISGLRASCILLNDGFLQEQAALCRMVNDFEDDITFLSIAALQSPRPQILNRYLDDFYSEETAAEDFAEGKRVKGRTTVSRKDIANFIAREQQDPTDEFQSSNAALAVGYMMSGYIHAPSQHIMEMYDPQRKRFITDSWPAHPFLRAHLDDIWSYFYRGIVTFGFASHAIGRPDIFEQCMTQLAYFGQVSGRDC